MVTGSVAHTLRKIGALAMVAALLATTPAFAEPASTSSTSTTSPDTIATPKKTTTPAPTSRTPATTRSEIDVNTNAQTQEFRDKLARKQARADEFKAQLSELDRELEIASEQYNASVDRLAEMKQRLVSVQGDLDNAQAAYDMQADILGQRASSMYRDGSLATVEILLDAKSVSDLMSRMKFLNTIGVRDADIAASLEAQKELLERQVKDLKNTEAVAQSLEFELEARQIEVMLRIQERQDLLADAEDDIRELLEEEAQRRSTEDSAIFAEVLSGANAKGIVVEPGGPVETVLAYHGIPYLWGGETTSGFDCSGLVLYVFRQHGVKLPHYSGSQFRLGEKVPAAQMLPGDAVFFGSPIHHVGIYVGGGYYIHAPRTGDFVKISKLSGRSDFAGARRYAWEYRVGEPKNAVKSTAAALKSVAR